MLQIRAKLVYNKKVKGNYFYLVLKAPRITKGSLPGQFLNIKINDAYEPLLRRPFSIYRTKGTNVEILYEVVGKGTEILSQRKAGEYLDVIGPLGNGFVYRLPFTVYRLPILVAGGMGVAPLIFLAEKLAKSQILPNAVTQRSYISGSRSDTEATTTFGTNPNGSTTLTMALKRSRSAKSQIHVLIGAKSKNEILCEKEFKDLGCEVKISTDDGSVGFKGKATELLDNILASGFRLQASGSKRHVACSLQRAAQIYACGPRPMLEEISQISQKYRIPAQISLEEHMACGIGACLGCVVKTKEGFKRVCKEGPVFNTDEIIW